MLQNALNIKKITVIIEAGGGEKENTWPQRVYQGVYRLRVTSQCVRDTKETGIKWLRIHSMMASKCQFRTEVLFCYLSVYINTQTNMIFPLHYTMFSCNNAHYV